jgi:hypothetical protein
MSRWRWYLGFSDDFSREGFDMDVAVVNNAIDIEEPWKMTEQLK